MSNNTTKQTEKNTPFGWAECAEREKRIMLQELAQVMQAVAAIRVDTKTSEFIRSRAAERTCNKLDEMRAELATIRETLGLCDVDGDDMTGEIDYEV
tara:strand:- start:1764 stop:2054 length:291 start_codon:yes stop_codon:yes gene_type:complete